MRSAEILTILHNSSTNYTDLTQYCHDFLRDSFTIEPLADDYIYVGYFKPINQIFIERVSGDANSGTMTGEYYNDIDEEWQSLSGFQDDTNNVNRSGFISWDRNQTNQGSVEIDSTELFWIRLKTGVIEETVIMAINIVFADDNDLKANFFNIMDSNYLLGTQTSHIASHVAAKRDIIQEIRNRGNRKLFKELLPQGHYSIGNLYGYSHDNINAWDILDIGEIRNAANYLALSKIFYNLSDSKDDYYSDKGRHYKAEYENAFNVFWLSIDINNDGLASADESLATSTLYMTR